MSRRGRTTEERRGRVRLNNSGNNVYDSLREQSAIGDERTGYGLVRVQRPARLNVSSCRLHRLPSAAIHDLLDGRAEEVGARRAAVAERVRDERNGTKAELVAQLAEGEAERRRGEGEHQRVVLA